mmetsp:Transcript_30249/g.26808  ORF Transcript_30249/g.26808 Transcript_30249/m.26808 type:complete len:148 (-) Transcript_30249:265-708(-)
MVVILNFHYMHYYTKSKGEGEKSEQLNDSYKSLGETLDMKYKVENSAPEFETVQSPSVLTVTNAKAALNKSEVSIIELHNKCWISLWGMSANFTISFITFPGLLLQGNISFIHDSDWEIWFIIFLFTVMDTTGRFLSGFATIKSEIG